jgi:Domain of unknown function (DUF4410)
MPVALLALLLALSACGGGGKAPTMPGGAKIALLVSFDRGTEGKPPEKVQQVGQLADYAEPDFLAILNKMGYEASRVDDPNTQPGPGRYVVRYRIIEYNAGSKAARMFVGYGAGSARLDTGYELIGPDGSSYTKGAPSVASSRDWKNAAHKVNQETAKAIDARLHQSL